MELSSGRSRAAGWPHNPVIIATALGLAIRVGFVLAHPDWPARGDALVYHLEANLLVAGEGWIDPLALYGPGHAHVASAAYAPLFTVVLAATSLVGLKSFLAHRLWCALIGTAAVPLGAWVGRELDVGRSVPALAAFGMAVYPNLWMSDGLGLSETLSPILVLLVLGAAYRMWRAPSWRRAALLGGALGLAALGRAELALLVLFILVPLALTRGANWSERGRMVGAGLAVGALVVGPWVGFNLSRFQDRVYISDRLGITMAAAECDAEWQGPTTGYWSLSCAAASHPNPQADESVQGAEAEHVAMTYIRHHLSGLPRVLLARVGRTFGVYRPVNQINLDVFVEGRPKFWAFAGLGMYYGLAVLAIPGAVVLRRRRITLVPMVAVLAEVVITVMVTYGQTRFRATFEPVLVLLAAVAVGAGAQSLRTVGTPGAAPPAEVSAPGPEGGGRPRPEPQVSQTPSGPS